MSAPHAPAAGDRVRHITTGSIGKLHGYDHPDAWSRWAMVRWDKDGPGMVDARGLARVAPGVLERLTSETPAMSATMGPGRR